MVRLRRVLVMTLLKMSKKGYSRNLSTCICDDSRYLKSIVDDSIIVCDINVMDSG